MSQWGWKNRRTRSFREYVPRWLRPLSTAVPWITVGLLFLMLVVLGGVFTSSEGALFALPEASVSDVDETTVVALLLPTPQGTLVFFDDTRYVLEDDAQMAKFREQLADRMKTADQKTLLTLADVRIKHGDILRFAGIAKRGGVAQVLFAEKRRGGSLE